MEWWIWLTIILTSPFWFVIVLVILGLVFKLILILTILWGYIFESFFSLFKRKKKEVEK